MMSSDLLKRAAGIVESYVSNNELPAGEIAGLLNKVYNSLVQLSAMEAGGSSSGGEGASGVGQEDLHARMARSGGRDAAPSDAKPAERDLKNTKPEPIIPISEAVREDAVICLICGKACKALKGHLTRSHKITIDDYRKMFDLPRSFQLVSPAYSEKRRKLAIDAGLGEKLRTARNRNRDSQE
ncbi:MAG: MucR family transcriptional regulator [Magnetococcales bacterium]|nr:MucR family transcriptional regulator [Magnetococcales bacterium]